MQQSLYLTKAKNNEFEWLSKILWWILICISDRCTMQRKKINKYQEVSILDSGSAKFVAFDIWEVTCQSALSAKMREMARVFAWVFCSWRIWSHKNAKRHSRCLFNCFTTGSQITWRPVPQNVFWSGQHDHLHPELSAYPYRTGGKLSKRPSGCLCTVLNEFWMNYRKYRLQWFLCIPGGYLVSWLTSLGRIAIWSVLLSNTIRISVKLGREV